MKGKQKKAESGGPSVPAYIVTFSDMVTLLLTFFVMLLSLANEQDLELIGRGRDSFIQSMEMLGLGVLFGRMENPHFGKVKTKFYISEADKFFKGRTIDAKEEGVRQIFQKVSRFANAMPSQIVAKRTDFSVTNIRFPPADATLNEPAKRFLTKFCSDLQQRPDSKDIALYVLGLAKREVSEKKQWILSARRAQAVAEFLQNILSLEPDSQRQYDEFRIRSQWPVYSWGAGPGGDWVGRDSPISSQSQILIGVLRTTD